MINIFIGYDVKETVAYHVLSHSLLSRASEPISISPLRRDLLKPWYTRPRATNESTDFSLTRFMVPYLSGYTGYSIFMDCDMLCLTDIIDVFSHIDGTKAVSVCQHDYVPSTERKFLNQVQSKYPRKNWSSFMVFNNALCKSLTPDLVNHATGLHLHRFEWIEDSLIGTLPLEWNWLVGEYPSTNDPKVLHYTLGTPCFSDYAKCEYSDVWWEEYRNMREPINTTLE